MKPYIQAFICLFLWSFKIYSAPALRKILATQDISIEKKDRAIFFIKKLQSTQLTAASTTSRRVEKKTVIPEAVLKSALQNLYAHPEAKFSRRDQLQAGETNKTFTFYGASVAFRQKNLKTKIKLRARFYLKIDKNGNTLRSQPGHGFLELKIKNPLPGQRGVHKYRIKLRDDLIFQVFTNPAYTDEFQLALQNIKESLSPSSKEYQTALIMLEATEYFSNIDSRFSQPVLGVSYTRDSYQQDILSHNVQITLDRNVQAYLPYQINHLNTFDDYLFEEAAKDLTHTYPSDIVVLELKEPMQISLKKTFKKDSLLERLRLFRQHAFCRAYVSSGFDIERNRGKAGTIRNLLYEKYL
ncbi:MAG: VTC domain-containing protein [Oligoflexales bacterium]